MKREIKWTTSDSHQITLSVEDRYELDRQGREKSGGHKTVVTTGSVDGVTITGHGVESITDHPVAVAKFGVIGLTPENYKRWCTVRDEVVASIASHNAECDRHAAELDAISTGTTNIEHTMRYGDTK